MSPAPKVIVSYDGTPTDRDALALGTMFAAAGCELLLAYVRHVAAADRAEELHEQSEADAMLAAGAESVGMPDLPRVVVWSPATGAGLETLAQREGASVIAFGSDYRTPAGSVRPGGSALRLLEVGGVAVAIAPARIAAAGEPLLIGGVGAIDEPGDDAARRTAESLAASVGANVVERPSTNIDLLVIASQAAAQPGRVALSGAAWYLLETARCTTLVLPRGQALEFDAGAAAA